MLFQVIHVNRVIWVILSHFWSFLVIYGHFGSFWSFWLICQISGSSLDITSKIVSSPKITLKTGSSLDMTLKIVPSPKLVYKTGSSLDIKSK